MTEPDALLYKDVSGEDGIEGIGLGKASSDISALDELTHGGSKGTEEEDDEYAGPSSLQYDAFHDGGRGD